MNIWFIKSNSSILFCQSLSRRVIYWALIYNSLSLIVELRWKYGIFIDFLKLSFNIRFYRSLFLEKVRIIGLELFIDLNRLNNIPNR